MFCLDTNAVIFAMNLRRPRVGERLEAEFALGTRLIVPAVVRLELEYGCARSAACERSREALGAFLSAGFEQPPFDLDDAREAGEIRAELEVKGTPIGAYCTLIAAQARRRGATLVTSNLREFERVPGLLLVEWAA